MSSWFLLIDMGADGIELNEYVIEADALVEYNSMLGMEEIDLYCQGVALIKGEMVKESPLWADGYNSWEGEEDDEGLASVS